MPVRVLLLTQWFDPEPTFKGLVFARELVRQGFEVEVLTGFPNYPGGKLYPGYRMQLIRREVVDGVHITRVPLYPNHDHSAWKRVLNYASFAASASIYGLLFSRRADVIYAYHPPLSVGVAACLIRAARRVPVVYDVQDMWPDTLAATGMLNNRKLLRFVSGVCNWVYRRVDRIVVLSPGFKALLVERGVPAAKVQVIYNWADEQSLDTPSSSLPASFPGAEHFRVIYAGNMGKAQALGCVLDAASLLKSQQSRVAFVLIGGGTETDRLRARAQELQLDNVHFFPAVPMAAIGTFLHSSDALLVHLRRDPLFEITIPSKTQAYMRIGKPLLMAVDGDAAALVVQASAGLTVTPEDPEALASAAQSLASMDASTLQAMGRAGKSFYESHLRLGIGVAQFATVLRDLAERAGKSRNHAPR